MNTLIIWKKNTCFNQVVYEWNIEKNQTTVRFISQSCKLSGILWLKFWKIHKSCLSLCSSLEVFINCNTNRHFLYLKKKYLNIETIFQEMNKEKILLSI